MVQDGNGEPSPGRNGMIEAGIRTAGAMMMDEDKIWSRYSNDKTDIGEHLARVLRTLSAAVPLHRKLRALSVGSSNEPQFQILESAFRGALYLLDIDPQALATVDDRLMREDIRQVSTIVANYNDVLHDSEATVGFREKMLAGSRLDLITLHHSLYYCGMETWLPLFRNMRRNLLARRGAIHAVLMAPESSDMHTTTWLYNHFAGKYFGVRNNQSLPVLKRQLEGLPEFSDTQIKLKTSRVRFFVEDFEQLMKVVWMILLYPGVHKYNDAQIAEIVSFVYDAFYSKKLPMYQMQHHLVLFRGIGFTGLA
ncbi:MAG: class I SAM-dependent methyltransferase [Chlorobiaceae bacterium]|nr:class I SAM-dependent methyltransferase [Chlorobiaceae bacterium]